MNQSATTRRLTALLFSALLLAALSIGARADAPVTRLRVAPAVSEIEVGEIVALEVRVEDVADLYGYQVELAYDPSLLQAVDAAGQPIDEAELGGFFAADLVVRNAVDAAAGRVEVMASNMGSAPSTGSGVLFTLRFTGLTQHVATVSIATGETILADTDGMAIPYSAQNANLYVGIQAPEPPGTRLCLPVLRSAAR